MKVAICIGSAKGWQEEVEIALKLAPDAAIYCVKENGIDWPGEFRTWVTLHPEWMVKYVAERAKLGLPPCTDYVCPIPKEMGTAGREALKEGKIPFRQISYGYALGDPSPGSGGFAVKVALGDGFERAICCGMPMQARGGHYRRKGNEWRDTRGGVSDPASFHRGWNVYKGHFAGRVRSMSGWTAELLGEPTKKWLSE